MASAGVRKWTDILTCRQVLNLMVILGFMFNYMLRVNLTIAIVEMIDRQNTSTTNANGNMSSAVHPASLLSEPKSSSRFAWTEAQKNDILGSFFWGYILTELPGGRLAEVVGARRVFGGGMLMASVLTILTPAACHANYYVVLGLRAALGFFLGATWPAIPPMAAKWIPPLERSKFIANMMASSLGAALTMPVCGFLISTLGWESVFYATGIVGLGWSVLWFLVVFDSPAQHPRISPAERADIEAKIGDSAPVNGGARPRTRAVPWAQVFASAPVWAIIVTHGCSVFCYFTVVNQLPTYMHQVLHFNIKENGLLSSLPYLGKYAMAIIASYCADRLLQTHRMSVTATRKLFTTVALLVPGMLMMVQCAWGRSAAVAVTVFTASLFFNGGVTAGYLSNGLDIAPNFSGTIFGLANTLSSFGGWLSTKIVAIATERGQTFDQWRTVFWVLVAAYLLGAAVYLCLGSGERQSWNSEQPKEKEMQPLKGTEKEIIA